MRVPKHSGHVGEKIDLGTPVPHLDDGGVLRTNSEQRRIGMQHLEIAANCNRLRNDSAVVENKRWHSLQRIDRRIFWSLVLHRHNVDLLGRNSNSLLGQKNSRAPRIWRQPTVIKLHP